MTTFLRTLTETTSVRLRIYVLECKNMAVSFSMPGLLNLARKCGLPGGLRDAGHRRLRKATGLYHDEDFSREIEELPVHVEFVVEEQEARTAR
jgi:hypothetical protein